MSKRQGALLTTALTLAAAGSGVFTGNSLYSSVIRAKRKTYHENDTDEHTRWLNTFENRRRRSIFLDALDRTKLHGVFLCEEKETNAYAIVVHDTGGCAEDVSSCARHYAERGMHVLLPELRGCGLSGGSYYGFGYDDRLDVLSWVHWVLKRDKNARILLHGCGAGANACLLAAAEHIPQAVYAIVSDSAFTSLKAFLIQTLDEQDSMLPLFLRLFLLRVMTRILAGYDIRHVSPLNAVRQMTVPALFLHGDADKQVPVEMCKKLYDEAGCARQIGVFLGATHLDAEKTQHERYWKLTDTFLEKHHPDRL